MIMKTDTRTTQSFASRLEAPAQSVGPLETSMVLVLFTGPSVPRNPTQVLDVEDTFCHRRPAPMFDLCDGRFLVLWGCAQACDG